MAGEIYRSQMDAYTKNMVDGLKVLGYKAMAYAYGKKGNWKHRTRNLHDSYGSAVFVNGKLAADSIRYFGGVYSRKADKVTKKTGRQTLNDFFRTYSGGAKNNEIQLVVIAAMFYAGILEAGGFPKKKTTTTKDGKKKRTPPPSRGPGDRYIVISPARDYIDKHLPEVVAKVNAIHGLKAAPKTRVMKGIYLHYKR